MSGYHEGPRDGTGLYGFLAPKNHKSKSRMMSSVGVVALHLGGKEPLQVCHC